MINRIRDAKKFFKPQGQISAEEWEAITDRFAYAKKFMVENNPVYTQLRDLLKACEQDIMENRLREVHNYEWNSFTNTVQRIFITPKKIQDDETVGQIKLLRQFFASLDSWIADKERYEKQEADGLIVIDRGDKK